MLLFKLLSIILIILVTLVAGLIPFYKRSQTAKHLKFPRGESLAVGVFLGAALIHMLSDSANGFTSHGIDYPLAFLLAGAVFLLFLWLEHKAREIYKESTEQDALFAIIATVMLCIHSFFAGAALGYLNDYSIEIVFLLAILAHKWAASFALAVQINKSTLSKNYRWLMFIIFAAMAPLGVIVGEASVLYTNHYPLIEPTFTALAAGTFLYLGTLHGLEQATLIKHCCNLNRFYYVIFGFIIMAVIAIWT